jgi:phosphopantothenoylcysteine decarboxylase/phosphopantothenate--cysteine ligase
MGYAVAAAGAEAGARVILISGPVTLPAPAHVERVEVDTADQMLTAVDERLGSCDLFIGTAAVSDYRAQDPAGQKIKKDEDRLTLTLIRNPDIIAHVAGRADAPFTVGFAAETDDLLEYAQRKLADKGLDMIVANRVGVPGEGFESETNALEVLWDGGRASLPLARKEPLARQLIALIARRYRERRAPD